MKRKYEQPILTEFFFETVNLLAVSTGDDKSQDDIFSLD